MSIVKIVIVSVLLIFMISFLVIILLYPIADHVRIFQKFYCNLGWHCHSKDYQVDYFDGVSEHCTCKWCGYKGMIDSQGNLF